MDGGADTMTWPQLISHMLAKLTPRRTWPTRQGLRSAADTGVGVLIGVLAGAILFAVAAAFVFALATQTYTAARMAFGVLAMMARVDGYPSSVAMLVPVSVFTAMGAAAAGMVVLHRLRRPAPTSAATLAIGTIVLALAPVAMAVGGNALTMGFVRAVVALPALMLLLTLVQAIAIARAVGRR